MKKRIALILSICLLFCLTGCSHGSGAGQTIYFEETVAPKNVDPLLATSSSELLAVQHLYQPLLKVDETGGLQPACAKGYTPSADRLSYTFTLREGLFWSDGVGVTAYDFAFALKRAMDPVTKATCAGQLTGIREVTVQDALTLTITLKTAGTEVLTALAGVAGMPCRQDFFENCGGRYGMGKDYVVANGAFYVSRWIDDDNEKYMRLAKNDKFYGKEQVLPASLYMTFHADTDRLVRMKEKDVDCAQLSSQLLEEATDQGLNTLSYESDSWGLLFNTKKDRPTANATLRKALVGSVDTKGLTAFLPGWCQPGESIIIPGMYYGTKPYGSPDSGLSGLAASAKDRFRQAMDQLEAEQIKSLTLCYVEGDGIRAALDYVVQCWQKQFGIYVSLTAVSEYELQNAVENQNFDIALISMGNQGKNTLEVLEQFSSSAENIRAGFAGKSYDTLLKKAKQAGESDLSYQQQCEKLLQTDCIVMPLYYTRSYYAYSPGLSGLTIDGFTRIPDFTRVEKLS